MRGFALTVIYWLSDLSVAVWLGGLVATGLLLASIDLASGADIAATIVAGGGPLDLLDRFRPLYIGAAVVLVSSIVFGFMLERDHRQGFTWWSYWTIRSAVIFALIGVALYGAGDKRSELHLVELSADMNREILRSITRDDGMDGRVEIVGDPSAIMEVLGDRMMGKFRTAFREYRTSYYRWATLEGMLAASILLLSGYREATWLGPLKRLKKSESTGRKTAAPPSDTAPGASGSDRGAKPGSGKQ